MSDTITLTVPDLAAAHFVVETSAARVPAKALSALGAPFSAEAGRRLGTARLSISEYPVGESPWRMPRTGLPGATRHVAVSAVLRGADRPLGLRLARALARAIALHTDGVAVDIDSGAVLAPHPERAVFALADEWLGVDLPPYRAGGRCTADEEDADGCSCVELTTTGLRRFGLPELRISGVSCLHDLAALNLLRAAAQRLLPLASTPGVHVLPAEFPLGSDDFAAYWGTPTDPWRGGPVPVRLTTHTPHLLGIAPPTRFPGSLNRWLWDELPSPLYDALSSAPAPEPLRAVA
ncbi:hypothetical protein [Actinomadura parmotrematis]|uniref:DUF3396 domain-containing protein n=1 Tax=Actinomadura parmotrematis TaxID=2864039 RepID=A0ABS7G0Y1_9ACTN|nr:hypothetical protein [Actinomadura parmotrematis]MBW8486146.1 hypothetical protein [Actinomadura parmotrematis]